jgi:hypothetical protein
MAIQYMPLKKASTRLMRDPLAIKWLTCRVVLRKLFRIKGAHLFPLLCGRRPPTDLAQASPRSVRSKEC